MNYRYSESFAGIGAWGKAIERVTKRHGDTCELQWYAEIDKYASNAFAAIHEVSEDLNIWDITTDQEVKPMDIFFYSPPCQTFSIAGKREGTTVAKGNLFYEAAKFIKQTKPKYAIMENVKGLPTGDTKKDFYAMLQYLEEIGYHNDWRILNTKDYGIPQNRERVFVVSIRQDLYDQGKRFYFPKPFKLETKLSKLLQQGVESKYYLSEKMLKGFLNKPGDFGQRFKLANVDSYAMALTCNAGSRITDNFIGIAASRGRDTSNPSDRTTGNKNLEQRLEINKQGLCNTLTSVQKDNYVLTCDGLIQETLKINSATKGGYEEASPGDSVNLEHPNSTTRRGRVGKQVSQTLTTSCNIGYYNGMTIRKLTPLECFRLQGFSDEDYYKAVEAYDTTFGGKLTLQKAIEQYEWVRKFMEKPMTKKSWKYLNNFMGSSNKNRSDTQMYMRAGNSITVNVIEEILENLLYDRKQEGQQLSLF